MLNELIRSFFFIFMAEMGDKTQILAMAFATKYPLKKVLLGVLIGSLLNHGLAVLLGTYLTFLIPLGTVKLLAAIAFIIFGMWTLNIGHDEEEEASKSTFGPIMTVALAFFIGELGDKTQLTAITLSTQGMYPLFILMGTVLGMVFTSGIGIFVGSKLGKRIPEVTLKMTAAIIFILFGVLGLSEAVPSGYVTSYSVTVFISILAVITGILIRRAYLITSAKETPFKKAATQLYLNTQRITQSLENICFGEKACQACHGGNCTVDLLKKRLEDAQKKEEFLVEADWNIPICQVNQYDLHGLKESLIETMETCLQCKSHQSNCVGNQTRIILENLYFGETIPYTGNRQHYYNDIKKRDPHFFQGRL